MKNCGKRFEEDFKNSIPYWCWCYRLRDSTGTWQGGQNTRFTPSNICDFIVMGKEKLYLLELKSVKGTSLPFTNIREKQITGLSDIQHRRIESMFIINFRSKSKTFAISACKLNNFIKNANRKSVPIKWCMDNAIEIVGTKKVTRYRYKLSELFD